MTTPVHSLSLLFLTGKYLPHHLQEEPIQVNSILHFKKGSPYQMACMHFSAQTTPFPYSHHWPDVIGGGFCSYHWPDIIEGGPCSYHWPDIIGGGFCSYHWPDIIEGGPYSYHWPDINILITGLVS